MSVSMKSLGLDRLSHEERRALADELMVSLANECQSGVLSEAQRANECQSGVLSEAQRAELLRRAAEDEADVEEGIPWEQVKAEARMGLES